MGARNYMINLIEIFNMHGYGAYVYSAYTIVLAALCLHFIKIINHNKQIKSALSDKYANIGAHCKHQARILTQDDMKNIKMRAE